LSTTAADRNTCGRVRVPGGRRVRAKLTLEQHEIFKACHRMARTWMPLQHVLIKHYSTPYWSETHRFWTSQCKERLWCING